MSTKARHQIQGDGAPVLITMKIPHPWVPLEVLALDGQQVQADIYFLTDMPISTSDVKAKIGQSAVGSEVPGAPGLQLAYQEQVNLTLFHDLSTDCQYVRLESFSNMEQSAQNATQRTAPSKGHVTGLL